jgi:hypothetical protein
MTSPSLPPNRRRWRSLVVGIVLAGAVLTWWCHPVRDPRFVGKWTYDEPGDVSKMLLSSNGTARWSTGFNTQHYSGWWRLDGKILRLDPHRSELASWTRCAIDSCRAGKLVPRPEGLRFLIVDASEYEMSGYELLPNGKQIQCLFYQLIDDPGSADEESSTGLTAGSSHSSEN